MASLLSTRYQQALIAHYDRDAAAHDRFQRAVQIHAEYAVEMDVLHYWLPELIKRQKLDSDPATVTNRLDPSGPAKASDPVFVKALQERLGEGFKVGIKKTLILRRQYIEVSYVPRDVRFEEYISPLPRGA